MICEVVFYPKINCDNLKIHINTTNKQKTQKTNQNKKAIDNKKPKERYKAVIKKILKKCKVKGKEQKQKADGQIKHK